ncbi:hypothetical protein RBB75_20760 (plasmid) [Tunturibacter empetritectus]|uniref:Uncharacterized protein n=1 Tax=Tunturiibacter empetritectus TaxID=3069691 RepID=A0AAU7ZIQ3_9BACT
MSNEDDFPAITYLYALTNVSAMDIVGMAAGFSGRIHGKTVVESVRSKVYAIKPNVSA